MTDRILDLIRQSVLDPWEEYTQGREQRDAVVCCFGNWPHQEGFIERTLRQHAERPWIVQPIWPEFITEPTRIHEAFELVPPKFPGRWTHTGGGYGKVEVQLDTEETRLFRKVGIYLDNIPNPNERILYYGGRQVGKRFSAEVLKKAMVNVGTIGHCDWSPYSETGFHSHVSILRQAIRDINNDRFKNAV